MEINAKKIVTYKHRDPLLICIAKSVVEIRFISKYFWIRWKYRFSSAHADGVTQIALDIERRRTTQSWQSLPFDHPVRSSAEAYLSRGRYLWLPFPRQNITRDGPKGRFYKKRPYILAKKGYEWKHGEVSKLPFQRCKMLYVGREHLLISYLHWNAVNKFCNLMLVLQPCRR